MRDNDSCDSPQQKPSSDSGVASALFLCIVAVFLVIALAVSASMLRMDESALKAQAPVDNLTTGSVQEWHRE